MRFQDAADMLFDPPLEPARLIRRYKRFLADAELLGGRTVTLHCPNTGAMTGCAEPGSRIWYWDSANERRKYPLTWELVERDDGAFIGVNTLRANRLVREALSERRLRSFEHYAELSPEVALGGARIDFRLSGPGKADCYIEVKSVTLGQSDAKQDGLGLFPDAPSKRALNHLDVLSGLARKGSRAVLLYCAQHTAIRKVSAAERIDPDYAQGLRRAREAGVEVMACGVHIDPRRIEIGCELPVGA
jgi:sugar fermentation stimulation protein A